MKTMGFHKYSVTCVLLLGEEEMFMTTVGRSAIQSYVVVSAGKDAEVKIWWDGGSAINCLHIHPSTVKELRLLGGLVSYLGLGSTLLSSPKKALSVSMLCFKLTEAVLCSRLISL